VSGAGEPVCARVIDNKPSNTAIVQLSLVKEFAIV
jgi:hypothetical protein